MGIYSANRMGNLALDQVSANESYTSSDFGRILYESAVNDQKVFESILRNDMREIYLVREGTVLESEIRAMNEGSVKEFFGKMKTRIMEFFGKIKGAIKSAITKISAYVLRDGKAFVKNYNNVIAKAKKTTVDVSCVLPTDYTFGNLNEQEVESFINKSKGNSEYDKDAIVEEELGRISGKGGKQSPEDFRTYVMEQAFNEDGKINSASTSDSTIKSLLEIVEKGSSTVKRLKAAEKTAQNTVKYVSNRITAAEKDANADNSSEVINRITGLVSICEKIVTIVSSMQIKICKKRISVARKALGAVMSQTKVSEAAAIDGDPIAAEAEYVAAMDDGPEDDVLDPETQGEVDDLVENAIYY